MQERGRSAQDAPGEEETFSTVTGARTGERPLRILVVHNRYQIRGGEDAVVEQEVMSLRRAGQTVETLFVDNDGIGPSATASPPPTRRRMRRVASPPCWKWSAPSGRT